MNSKRDSSSDLKKNLREKLALLPHSPGVYLMKDRQGRVIYVGKAKKLRNRVKTYFSSSRDSRYSTHFIARDTDDFDFILTETEKEAFILEDGLIKKYRPRYNVMYKDDKTYVSLRIDLKDAYPRLHIVRKPSKDKALYFGPYSSSSDAKSTLKFIHDTFGLRSCTNYNFRNRTRPCLNYQIKKCLGPCTGNVSGEDYRRAVEDTVLFLRGRDNELVKELKRRMWSRAENKEYEEAALLRRKIEAIESTLEQQRVVSSERFAEFDVAALARETENVAVQIMFIRQGRIVGHSSHRFKKVYIPDSEALSSFLMQFYRDDREIPADIFVWPRLEGSRLLAEVLAGRKGKSVRITSPVRGEKRGFVDLALKNAKEELRRLQNSEATAKEVLQEMQKEIHLSKLPAHIECFDISNISGKFAVGSQVSFIMGRPDRNLYRRYRIRSKDQPDDYAMMYEVLYRRFSKIETPEKLPDLLVVDGGKGQLNIAREVLRELNIKGVNVIALAKERDLRQGRERVYDRVYLPNRKNPLQLSQNPDVLKLLMRIRDEAHRFAVSYFHKLKKSRDFASVLDEIPHIGPARKKGLLKHFGSIKKIGTASAEELLEAPNMTRAAAKAVKEYFSAVDSKKG